MTEQEKQKIRFFKMANGLMSIAYIALFAYFLAELSSLIF